MFVGGGYLRSVDFEDKCGGCLDDMVISGGYGAVGGGVDYFLTPVFALGARLDVELAFVGRDAVPKAMSDISHATRLGNWIVDQRGLALQSAFLRQRWTRPGSFLQQ